MNYTWPSDEQFACLQTQTEIDGAVTMLNLLSFKETADYVDNPQPTNTADRRSGQTAGKHRNDQDRLRA